MKKQRLAYTSLPLLLMALFFLTACGGGDQSAKDTADEEMTAAASTETDADADGEWRVLFGGDNLNGWHSYNQDKLVGWSIEDGALTNVAEGGTDLASDEGFEDFELSFEWKVPENGNSGLMFRVVESDEYNHPWQTGPEYQLLDDYSAGFKENLKPSQFAAANYDMEAPAKSVSHSTGEWNEGRLIVNGNHVEHWLNGEKVIEYELGSDSWKEQVQNSKWKQHPGYGKAPSGHLVFQGDHTKVWLRDIKIKTL